MFLALIEGVALLLALSLLYGFNIRYWKNRQPQEQVTSGVLFGALCIIGMMLPIVLTPGVIFDGRSVVLSIAALFGGPVVAIISAVIAGGYRIWLGGVGVYVGVAVVLVCSSMGLVYRYLYQRGKVKIELPQLLLFGLIVHLLVVLVFTQLPADIAKQVIENVALPFLLTFTPATAILGLLLKDTSDRLKIEAALAESESLLSRHLQYTPLAAITWNTSFRCTQWNKAAEKIFGYSAEEALGRHAAELILLDHDIDAVNQVFTSLLEQKGGWQNTNQNKTRDGRIITCDWYNTTVLNATGEVVSVASLSDDITRQKQADDEIKLMNTLLLTQHEASIDGIFAADTEGKIISMNQRFLYLWQVPDQKSASKSDKAVLKSILDRLEAPTQFRDKMRHLRENPLESSSDEIALKDGQMFESYSAPMIGSDDELLGRVWWFRDITERKQSEELIWQQANFDSLTGLANRQMLHEKLAGEIRSASRSGKQIALLYLDLDQFKEVNDTLGHDKGDLLLVEAAERIDSAIREVDTLARLGGDEFTIIMGGLDNTASIERVANDILEKLAMPFQLGLESAYISTSIGITLYPRDASDADEMLKNADQAMYAAKDRGRNCFQYFTTSMQQASLSRMEVIRDLREALPNKQFRLYYQPILELSTGNTHKAEALIRWQHPTRGLVSPIDFIPLAEESRLIIDIGDWVFREAARQVQQWQERIEGEFQVSVNTSPVQFQNESFDIDEWLQYLREIGLSGSSIALEVTEGLLMETITPVAEKFLTLRDAGIQVALDDFGTGYSSLSYLQKFDIDYLKIDQSFVKNLQPECDDLALCEAIIMMAHKLGLKVIAEGIETEQQKTLLAAAGCDYGQGYWFSKPLPASEFEQFLTAK